MTYVWIFFRGYLFYICNGIKILDIDAKTPTYQNVYIQQKQNNGKKCERKSWKRLTDNVKHLFRLKMFFVKGIEKKC